MEKAEKKGVQIHLPTDFITADKFDKDAQVYTVEFGSCDSHVIIRWGLRQWEGGYQRGGRVSMWGRRAWHSLSAWSRNRQPLFGMGE